jgi:hypothetical protein
MPKKPQSSDCLIIPARWSALERDFTPGRFSFYRELPSYSDEAGESRAYEFCTIPLTFLNSPPVCNLVPSTCSSHTRL